MLHTATGTELDPVRVANQQRFSRDLEFLSALSNPYYLHQLSQQGYFDDPAFLNYLEYLEYFRAPHMKSFALLSPTLRGRMTPLRAKLPIGPLGAAILPFHTAAPRAANDKSAQDKLVDERIAAPLIQLVDPTSGQLQGPFKPQDILAKIDRKAYLLVQVTKGAMDDSKQKTKEWSLRDLPICRLINKRMEYERQREKKKKPTSTQSKALSLSWNVSDHDLSHKLSKARRELERGHQVRVEISAKSGTPRALPGSQEADGRLQLVEHILSQLTQTSPTKSEATLARITSPPSWNRSRTLVAFVLQGSGAA